MKTLTLYLLLTVSIAAFGEVRLDYPYPKKTSALVFLGENNNVNEYPNKIKRVVIIPPELEAIPTGRIDQFQDEYVVEFKLEIPVKYVLETNEARESSPPFGYIEEFIDKSDLSLKGIKTSLIGVSYGCWPGVELGCSIGGTGKSYGNEFKFKISRKEQPDKSYREMMNIFNPDKKILLGKIKYNFQVYLIGKGYHYAHTIVPVFTTGVTKTRDKYEITEPIQIIERNSETNCLNELKPSTICLD